MVSINQIASISAIIFIISVLYPSSLHASGEGDFYVVGDRCKLVRKSHKIETGPYVVKDYGELIMACNSTVKGIKCRPSNFEGERAKYLGHKGIQKESGYVQYAAAHDGFSIEITAAVNSISRVRTADGEKVFERVVCDGGYHPVAIIE